MKLTRFWIVTYPTKQSTLQDICFQVDMDTLYKQFMGGLKPENIAATYTEKSLAEEKAKLLLHRIKRNL